MRGWLNPATPDDIPLDVADWIEPVAEALAQIDAQAARKQWGR